MTLKNIGQLLTNIPPRAGEREPIYMDYLHALHYPNYNAGTFNPAVAKKRLELEPINKPRQEALANQLGIVNREDVMRLRMMFSMTPQPYSNVSMGSKRWT